MPLGFYLEFMANENIKAVRPGIYATAKAVTYETIRKQMVKGTLETISTPGGQRRIVVRDPLMLELIAALEAADGE